MPWHGQCRERGIKAGLDVFEGEPSSGTGTIDNPLFALEGVVGTHHIGRSDIRGAARNRRRDGAYHPRVPSNRNAT